MAHFEMRHGANTFGSKITIELRPDTAEFESKELVVHRQAFIPINK